MINNIHVDPKTADLWVGGVAKPALTINYMGNPANDTNHAPAQVRQQPRTCTGKSTETQDGPARINKTIVDCCGSSKRS